MAPGERRRLSWGRFVAYLLWPGMQPSHFLPERTPTDSQIAPTLGGTLLNFATGATLLWVVPALTVEVWPFSLRVAVAFAGFLWIQVLGGCDALALQYRDCGIGVEKLWDCPIAATSLMDFWGRRWNRIFSGMLREILFLPLARRLGPTLALFAVFLYSGLLHENFSFGARSGYGGALLYFAIQGAATWLEGRRVCRRFLLRHAWLGRLWTAAVVLVPLPIMFHEGFRDEVLPPLLGLAGVPGVRADP
jgi:alginate O-acetyltransferase complex protein AlgI